MIKPTREEIVDKVEELVKTKRFHDYLAKSQLNAQVRLSGYNTFYKHHGHISALRFVLNPDFKSFSVLLDHKANGYLVEIYHDIKMPQHREKKEAKPAEPKVKEATKKPKEKVAKKSEKAKATPKKATKTTKVSKAKKTKKD